jgi:ADP-ribose diphosphatase
MPTPPKILKREAAIPSQLFKAEALELEFSNGQRRRYERLLGNSGAVLIVPIIDGQVILVREYGAGVERYELALPKGKIDPGETPFEAANRELQEEVGYKAADLILLKTLSQSPNYMQHRTHIVLARNLSPSQLPGDEPEPLIVERFALSAIDQLVLLDDFTEARSVAALYLARAFLLSNQKE